MGQRPSTVGSEAVPRKAVNNSFGGRNTNTSRSAAANTVAAAQRFLLEALGQTLNTPITNSDPSIETNPIFESESVMAASIATVAAKRAEARMTDAVAKTPCS